jgi:hypothetical protein
MDLASHKDLWFQRHQRLEVSRARIRRCDPSVSTEHGETEQRRQSAFRIAEASTRRESLAYSGGDDLLSASEPPVDIGGDTRVSTMPVLSTDRTIDDSQCGIATEFAELDLRRCQKASRECAKAATGAALPKGHLYSTRQATSSLLGVTGTSSL